jgi:hypothetical protein
MMGIGLISNRNDNFVMDELHDGIIKNSPPFGTLQKSRHIIIGAFND